VNRNPSNSLGNASLSFSIGPETFLQLRPPETELQEDDMLQGGDFGDCVLGDDTIDAMLLV
jgi:hypothetical protein